MAKPSELLEKIKSLREKITSSPAVQTNTFLLLLMEKIKALELMLLNSELKQELAAIKATTTNEPVKVQQDDSHLSLKEKTERLVKVATHKTVEGKTLFLLHRPTEDFEYEKGINSEKSEFTTHKESEWIADFEESTAQRIGNNPVVAVWVPEADIKDVPNAFSSEDNTWGDLGTNPNKNKYRVTVQAGTYKLYQELKKSGSIYSLMKGIEALKKSSQFVKLPPELLKIGQKEKQFNTKEDGISMDRAQALLSSGKLNPKDVDTIIQNRNQDLTRMLLAREDLTADQLKKIAGHKDSFVRRRTHDDNNEGHTQIKRAFTRILHHEPDYMDEVVKGGQDQLLEQAMHYAPSHIGGEHLMYLATKRPDLTGKQIKKMSELPEFDSGHAIEFLKHPAMMAKKGQSSDYEDSSGGAVAARMIETLHDKNKLNDNVLQSALAHANPEVTQKVLQTETVPIEQSDILKLLKDHPDGGVKAEAAGRIKSPQLVEHVIKNLQSHPQHKEIFHNMVNGSNLGWGEKKAGFTPEHLDAITDYALAKNPALLDGGGFWENDNIAPHSLNKIFEASLNSKTKLHGLESKTINPESIQVLLNHDKNHDLMKRVAASHVSTPDQIKQAWNQADKKKKDFLNNADISEWINNKNTPGEVINEIVGNADKLQLAPNDMFTALKRPELAPEHMAKYMASPFNKHRTALSSNPSLSSEHILAGIQDKDKDVRNEFLRRQDLQPAHFAVALKDRAPSNRVMLVKHPNITPELLHQVITKDKSGEVRAEAIKHPNIGLQSLLHAVQNDPDEKVRTAALQHQNATPELVDLAMANPTADHAIQLADKNNLTPEQIAKLAVAAQQRMKSLTSADGRMDYTTRNQADELKRTIYKLVTKPNIDPTFKTNFLKTVDNNTLMHVLDAHSNVSPEVLKHAYEKYQGSETSMHSNDRAMLLKGIVQSPNVKGTGILEHIIANGNDSDHEGLMGYGAQNMTPEQQKHLIVTTKSSRVVGEALENPHTSADVIQALYNKHAKTHEPNPYELKMIVRHPNASLDILNEASQHPQHMVRAAVAANPKTPEEIIYKLLKDSDEPVRKVAGDAMAHINPDRYNASLDDAHEVYIHPAVEKLKHLKGIVQSAGGTIPKKSLDQKYQNMGFLFDGQGNVTEQTIEKYLHELPKSKYNISYRDWNGAQMHDDGKSGPQKVVQVNLTNDHVKELKDKGLYDTFRQIHQQSHLSGRPVNKHSLGWARIDTSHPEHWHIDEIQSDLGQGTIRQIQKARDNGQIDEGKANKHMEDLKGIMKVLSGPFKNINHAISGAVHQTAREKGIKTTSMDTIEDQAKQSGMTETKELPGHMQNTYKQVPEELGYTLKPKKEVMPNTTAPEESVQYRKLIKTMSLFQLLKEIERMK